MAGSPDDLTFDFFYFIWEVNCKRDIRKLRACRSGCLTKENYLIFGNKGYEVLNRVKEDPFVFSGVFKERISGNLFWKGAVEIA